jgi:hypothetical protein
MLKPPSGEPHARFGRGGARSSLLYRGFRRVDLLQVDRLQRQFGSGLESLLKVFELGMICRGGLCRRTLGVPPASNEIEWNDERCT